MSRSRSAIAALIAIPILILACAGFAIGLTFAPCYSSMCVEHFFPYQTRIHIAVFYSLVASIVITSFALRHSSATRRFVALPVYSQSLLFGLIRPIIIGQFLLAFWVLGVGLASTAYWLPAERAYWMARGMAADGWVQYMPRVIWTGVTGHWIDIWIGLTIMPVGRNSLLGRTFCAQRYVLLWAHKMLGYLVLVGGVIHGLLYYSFLAAWLRGVDNEAIFEAFNPDNPTLTWTEAEDKGIYSWFCLPTGAVAGLVLITATTLISLPYFRRNHYNTFYFTHVVLAVAILVLLSLHASTNFYFLLPGLLLWVYDWVSRLQNALLKRVSVDLEDAGSGWYRVRLPSQHLQPGGTDAPHKDLELNYIDDMEAPQYNPLQTYYINISQVNRLETHPLTVVSDREDGSFVLLLRKSPEREKPEKRDLEWTWRLAALLQSQANARSISLQARLEGPYTPQIDSLSNADHVLAIVGGTGITGAISLANWWIQRNRGVNPHEKSLSLVWTVRGSPVAEIAEIDKLKEKAESAANVTFRIHDSTKSGRLSAQDELARFVATERSSQGTAWVYASGPASLSDQVEDECRTLQRRIRPGSQQEKGGLVALDYYIASYDL